MKNVKMHILATVAVTSLIAMACNNGEDSQVACADGAVEKDGACVAEATCGEGTVVMNGSCVPEQPECGDGTVLSSSTNTCVPTRDVCAEGTSFDGASDTCIPDTEVTCGDGTVAQGNTCIPSELACGSGTQFVDGNCVVAAAACGPKTQLDANNGSCVATDEVCGANTAFSGGSCLPTADVCDVGTIFNEGMGVCLPEATCRAGDVVIDGQCVPPIVERANNPDVAESENNDPALGGLATMLDLSTLMDGDTLTVSGTIGQPIDINGDGELDQDIDAFRFAADTGDYFRITVEPVRDTLPVSFEISGVVDTDTAGILRQAPHATGRAASRQFVATATGNFDIRVAPVAAFTGQDTPALGSMDDAYIMTIERLMPTVTDHDTSTTPSMTGSLYAVKDNVYRITDLTNGEKVTIAANSLGANVGDARVYVWSSPTVLVGELPLSATTQAAFDLPTPEALISFDWVNGGGPDMSYDIAVAPRQLSVDLGTLAAGMTTTSTPVSLFPDESYTYNFTAAAGEVLRIRQTNDEGAPMDLIVYDAANNVVATLNNFAAYGPGEEGDFFRVPVGQMDQSYRVVLTPRMQQNFNGITLEIESRTPTDLGTFGPGQTIAIANTGALLEDEVRFYSFILSDNVTINGTIEGGGNDVNFGAVNLATGQLLLSGVEVGDETLTDAVLPAGEYLFTLLAVEDAPNGAQGSLALTPGPNFEIEPNNDAMTAQPITDFNLSYAGITYSIESNPQGDPDYYSITVASDSIFRIEGTSVNADDSVFSDCFQLNLEDDMGTELFTTGTSGPDTFDESFYLRPGTYYVVMTGWCSSTTTTINYFFDVSLEAPTYDAFDTEPNDSAAGAQSVVGAPTPLEFAGTVDAAMDEDWYLIDLNPGLYVLDLTNLPGNPAPHAGMTVELYDSSGTTLLGESFVSIDTASSYLVKISGHAAMGINDYLLLISEVNGLAETEPNNDAFTAQLLGAVTFPTTIFGELDPAMDQDWFQVDLQPGTYNFALSARPDGAAPSSSMKAELFNADGTIKVGEGTVPVVTAGTYQIKISGFSMTGENRYRLVANRFDFASAPSLAIPDDDPAGTTDTIVVPAQETCVITELQLFFDISHTYRGDLNVELTSPLGTSVLVLATSFDSTDDYIGVVPVEIIPDNPLTPFNGEALAGTWTLFLEDTFGGDTGTLNSWALLPTCQ